jgi:hypothetical protein
MSKRQRADGAKPMTKPAAYPLPLASGKAEAHTFARKVFRCSRLADYATVAELTKQIRTSSRAASVNRSFEAQPRMIAAGLTNDCGFWPG